MHSFVMRALRKIERIIEGKFLTPLIRFSGRFFWKKTAIIMVDGGVGSVLAKYAIGQCIRKKLGVRVKYDLTWFKVCGMDCDNKYKRSFELRNVFPNLDFEIASDQEVIFYKKYFYFKNEYPFKYCEALFSKKRPLYVDGGFDHWRYWTDVREELLCNLNFDALKLNEENHKFLNMIASDNVESIAVHVRRGDYINLSNFFHILPPEYFLAAIQYIKKRRPGKKLHFFFFSNGMDWVKENIISQLPKSVAYSIVDINDNDTGYFDLYLISRCKHQISSNSAFGYWGGFFNQYKEKIVIIPEKFFVAGDETFTSNIEEARSVPGWVMMTDDGVARQC